MAGVSEMRENQGQLVFGLDIGTRSIVGTVGYLNGTKFHVLGQYAREHETRAMLDGQIHDINKVADTIASVKRHLEDDLNRNLTEVCIAAAGRVLRTVTIKAEQQFESEKEITDEDVYALDTLGIEKAYEEFQKSNDTDMKFYCVGYTPMRYYMNGYQIGNLEGHKAKTIAADLIATFLPDDVVSGLYKAVELAGLHVTNLTLEPIAAIQVAIPEKFRMLNMALVDVGAGTSDISITKEGTITAYGMIPVAGDSLTDIIVQHCLVDFETAEMIKRKATVEEMVEYQDIMGLPQVITAEEVKDILNDTVTNMTKMVAATIKELNGDKPVSAVFVVGGGGMVPGYTESLAKDLGIPKERVAIRGREVMQNIVFELENAQMDSLMVTPIGICLSFYEQSNNFIFVEFNESRMKLYDNGRLTVADAAMQVQFTNEDLFPKRGKALTFTVNDMARMVRGSQGEAAVITLNGDPADLHTQINSGDIIKVVASTEGDPGYQELGKLPELAEWMHVTVNGNKITLPKTAMVNDKQENEFYQIQEGDVITVQNCYTVAQVAEFLDVPLGGDIRVNDAPAKETTQVYENFSVSWDMNVARGVWSGDAAESGVTYADLPEDDGAESEYRDSGDDGAQGVSDGSKMSSAENENTVTQNINANTNKPREVSGRDVKVMANGNFVTLSGKDNYVFVDIFDHIDFNLSESNGRGITTLLNGKTADYMESLKDGDVIEIYWNESGK
ncbi:MAG: cell division protein FtsA [Lachnospiraceae bacterium]|nr:cell division protein FtsA [Lachnospiraceae bacterium]